MKLVFLGVLLFAGAEAYAQAVRLDSRATNPRISTRLNQERLQVAEARMESQRLDQRDREGASVLRTRDTAQARAAESQAKAATRKQRNQRKKKKKIQADLDFDP